MEDLISPSILTEYISCPDGRLRLAVTEDTLRDFFEAVDVQTQVGKLWHPMRVHVLFWHESTDGYPRLLLGTRLAEQIEAREQCPCSLRRVGRAVFDIDCNERHFGIDPASFIRAYNEEGFTHYTGFGAKRLGHIGRVAERLSQDLSGLLPAAPIVL